ncbi:T9SS type A sorting domain-containing protein [Jiulongibacter sp. NS-SX5]|uniref:T9SS type A sorting domain-containing protein n=1 Tax=Jiulongibacter sp. NS-SX5 TaxID=3463854 RepID=UPI0040597D4E
MRNSLTAVFICLSFLSFGQWTASEKVILQAGENTEFDVNFSYDDAGNTYYTWTDFRSGNGEIYIQKLNQFGEESFSKGGLRVGKVISGNNLTLCAKAIFPLTDGGLAVVWHEVINPSQNNIKNLRINRIDQSGKPVSEEGIILASSIINSDVNNAVLSLGQDSEGNLLLICNEPQVNGSDAIVQYTIPQDLSSFSRRAIDLGASVGSKVVFDKSTGSFKALIKSAGSADFKAKAYSVNGNEIIGSTEVFNNPFSGDSRIDEFYANQELSVIGRTLSGGGKNRVIAQKLNAELKNEWKSGGVVLGTDNAYDIHSGPNKNGGGIMAWIEPNLTETKMMAAGVDAQGNVLWQKPVFKTQPGKSYFTPHKFAPDGNGGCYVMWFTSKAVGFDMSIQHLDANGNQFFGEFGLQLTDFKWWSNFRLIPHKSGGVIALYSGSKNDDINVEEYDLYTSYISPEGEFGLEQKLSVDLEKSLYCAGETIKVSESSNLTAFLEMDGETVQLEKVEGGFDLPLPSSDGVYSLFFENEEGKTSEGQSIEIISLKAPELSSSAPSKCAETDETITLSGFCSAGALLWEGGETTSEILVSPVSSTTYQASCTKEGCMTSEKGEVRIEVPEIVVTTSGGGNVNEGSTVQLGASGGSSYSWSGPNGFVSTMQNPSLSNVSATESGIYSVVVTDENGCSASGDLNLTVEKVLSAENQGKDISIYPNPTQDFLRVSIDKNYLRATAVSLDGKQTTLPISADIIDLRSLSNGVYVLKLMDKSRVWHFFKVIKE